MDREQAMKPRLLLVEDDPTSRAFLAAALAALPAHVDTAEDCAQARSQARRTGYDLWLIDAHLPDGRGGDLLADLRADSPDVAALAHTAAREAAVHDALRAAGFAEVLVKPLSAAMLQGAVRRLLGLPDASIATATDEPATADAPVWDDAAALSALNGERAHVDALRALFRDELPAVRAAIHNAIARDDRDALRAALHRLDASCGFVGAARLASAVRALRAGADRHAALARFDRAVDELQIDP